jgi:hypothetical protein
MAKKFQPHVVILIERPSPLFVAAYVGFDSLVVELTGHSATWLRQAVQALDRVHPIFKARGFVINFSAQFSIEFTLNGEIVRMNDRCVEVPKATLATVH